MFRLATVGRAIAMAITIVEVAAIAMAVPIVEVAIVEANVEIAIVEVAIVGVITVAAAFQQTYRIYPFLYPMLTILMELFIQPSQ